jgi:prevent-host-death family protein
LHKVGLFEAKQKLSELVKRASEGEKIGITRRGKLAAIIVSAHSETNPHHIFDGIDQIRKRARNTKNVDLDALIGEGRE